MSVGDFAFVITLCIAGLFHCVRKTDFKYRFFQQGYKPKTFAEALTAYLAGWGDTDSPGEGSSAARTFFSAVSNVGAVAASGSPAQTIRGYCPILRGGGLGVWWSRALEVAKTKESQACGRLGRCLTDLGQRVLGRQKPASGPESWELQDLDR
ncbi:hypothetical protein BO99DRAFT_432978 [Aspergillus violaceofuscus CBS 115571]|uniref:Uncharacterized protein n=1 Tax=Aspergillus violaceofuscus (strain CBS 115571) TaxID=1450538 RepID=A0A2V5H4L6_ASPV1|nr:hypothetical protein BO99DRAFT_432978 [Aspergillus violaceofuscus CBS 115571]